MIRVSGPKSGPSLAALCSKGSKMPAERQVRASRSQAAAAAVADDDDSVDLCWFGPEGQGYVLVLIQRSSEDPSFRGDEFIVQLIAICLRQLFVNFMTRKPHQSFLMRPWYFGCQGPNLSPEKTQ